MRMDEFGDEVFSGVYVNTKIGGLICTTTVVSIELNIHSPLPPLSSLHICPS